MCARSRGSVGVRWRGVPDFRAIARLGVSSLRVGRRRRRDQRASSRYTPFFERGAVWL